ncbi:MAG TPA: hypothetical protein VJ959_02050 [Desulfotignum sp.]|nr:hypothetical protein [Desulfotignum sp.]
MATRNIHQETDAMKQHVTLIKARALSPLARILAGKNVENP